MSFKYIGGSRREVVTTRWGQLSYSPMVAINRETRGQYIENTIILYSRVLSTKWKSVTFPL